MLKRIFLIQVILSLVLLNEASYVFAAHDHHDPEDWEPVSAGPLTTWTAPLCGQGKFTIQPFFFYNKTRGTFNNDGFYEPLPNNTQKYQFQEQLFVQYGITDRLEIDVQILYQQNYAKQNDLTIQSSGLGESNLFLRYCLTEEQGWFPHFTALIQLKIPTGKYQQASPDKQGTDLMGNGSWDHGYGIILTKKIKPFLLHLDAIYNFSLETRVDNVKTLYGDYLNFDFGIEYFLPKGFSLVLEVNGLTQGNKKQAGMNIPNSNIKYLTIVPGIGWSNEVIQILLAYQRTLIGTNSDANDSIVVDFVYIF